jgi:hypothetical protein
MSKRGLTPAKFAEATGMTKGRVLQLIRAGQLKAKKVDAPVGGPGDYYYLIPASEVRRLNTQRSGMGRPRIGD